MAFPRIPGNAEKGGYSRPHIRTMSYIGGYPLSPRGECGSRPPPPGKSQIAKGFKEYKRVFIRTGYF